ncbi:hypothetical protein GHT07_04210 [Caenimonas koreensis DSM 17982]|uniref:DUF2946 domain-containing protein n=1 Tax=Caenimonas koreensis DSM 17982 TaxID=1121255 RepID=A0A844B582_9BURK|nr:hypothetical protein [Caenimonas koreensis]MRD46466.1 hypothetical protein [Caenimonas koreensis DSM 17982]
MLIRKRLLWFVLFALLAAQTLGLAHRVAHGVVQDGFIGDAAAASLSRATAQPHGGNWSDALRAGHGDDVTCHVFDQVSQGGCALALPALLPAVVYPEALIARATGEALARWAAQFEARGPPSLR